MGNTFDANPANTCDDNCLLEKFKVPIHNDGFTRTAPIGTFPQGASPYGVMDIGGNVWEWTSTLYRPYPYDAGDGREDPNSGDHRVLRGGGWSKYDFRTRVADRVFLRPDYANYDIGFRCVKSQ